MFSDIVNKIGLALSILNFRINTFRWSIFRWPRRPTVSLRCIVISPASFRHQTTVNQITMCFIEELEMTSMIR